MRRLAMGLVAIIAVVSVANASWSAPKKPAPKAAAKPKAPSAHENAVLTRMATADQAATLTSCDAVAASAGNLFGADTAAGEIEKGVGGDLATAIGQKDQFDTTAEHEAKVRKTLEIFVGDPDRVVFFVAPDEGDVTYNADRRQLTVNLSHHREAVMFEGYSGRRFFMIGAQERKLGSATGTTRLGVRFRYDRYHRYERYLAMPGDYGRDVLSPLTVEMAPEEARKRLRRYRVVFFGAMGAPYFERMKVSNGPSLDSPVAQATESDAWYVTPRCAFLFDEVSKAVIGKFVVRAQP